MGGTTRWGGLGERHEAARGPHATETMAKRERKREKKGGGETRGQENLGGAEELFPPEPASFSVTYARRSGGKKPNKAFFFSFQYFSFLGTSQGKLSLPKWP